MRPRRVNIIGSAGGGECGSSARYLSTENLPIRECSRSIERHITETRLSGKWECGVRSAECGVRSAECGVWKVKFDSLVK